MKNNIHGRFFLGICFALLAGALFLWLLKKLAPQWYEDFIDLLFPPKE